AQPGPPPERAQAGPVEGYGTAEAAPARPADAATPVRRTHDRCSRPRPAKRGEGSRFGQQSRSGEGRDKRPLTPTLSPLRGARERTAFAACSCRAYDAEA